MTLAVIAAAAGPVTSGAPRHQMMTGTPPMDLGYMLQPTVVATHTFRNAPALDVLLVPGGLGNLALEQAGDTSIEDFVRLRFDEVDYLLSVCTGAISLAKAGVLDGRRATSNKAAWGQVTASGKNVSWVPTARWVADGKVWTSSGVSAGKNCDSNIERRGSGMTN
jgi:putative intracellular protease/amidase